MRIEIDLAQQTLRLIADGHCLALYPVSTARNGPGELTGSNCTPRGRHIVRAKIGAGAAVGTVFVGRRPTGEVYSPELAVRFPGRDWILTRILWLSGCEPGRNRLGAVDTMRRYIYIHGSPDSVPMGNPGSIGCIRMRNADIVALFDRVAAGTSVLIAEDLSVSIPHCEKKA
jgi:L,D-transpeptidase YbiS